MIGTSGQGAPGKMLNWKMIVSSPTKATAGNDPQLGHVRVKLTERPSGLRTKTRPKRSNSM